MEINTGFIKKDATKLEKNIEELTSEKDKMVAILSTMKDTWGGKKSTSFYQNAEEYIKSLNKTFESMNNYPSLLKKVPEIYDALDNSYSNKKIDV